MHILLSGLGEISASELHFIHFYHILHLHLKDDYLSAIIYKTDKPTYRSLLALQIEDKHTVRSHIEWGYTLVEWI